MDELRQNKIVKTGFSALLIVKQCVAQLRDAHDVVMPIKSRTQKMILKSMLDCNIFQGTRCYVKSLLAVLQALGLLL